MVHVQSAKRGKKYVKTGHKKSTKKLAEWLASRRRKGAKAEAFATNDSAISRQVTSRGKCSRHRLCVCTVVARAERIAFQNNNFFAHNSTMPSRSSSHANIGRYAVSLSTSNMWKSTLYFATFGGISFGVYASMGSRHLCLT